MIAAPAVPAGDGYWLLTFGDDGSIRRSPIIAWRIDGFDARPISLDLPANGTWWQSDHRSRCAILRPDGTIQTNDFHSTEFETEDTWLNWCAGGMAV